MLVRVLVLYTINSGNEMYRPPPSSGQLTSIARAGGSNAGYAALEKCRAIAQSTNGGLVSGFGQGESGLRRGLRARCSPGAAG